MLEVMSLSVDINEKKSCDYGHLSVFFVSEQLLLTTHFFPEHLQCVLARIT